MDERRRLMMRQGGGDIGSIDLSMVDNAGNPRVSMSTANCYLVHAAGDYKIPLVYGNAIKDGTVNAVAFMPGGTTSETYCANFVNHNDDEITGPWITRNGTGVDAGMGLSAVSAELLWQDVTGLISKVKVYGDYLKFTVGTFNPGNALIAVKDGSGVILWSWHIWATNDDLSNTTVVSTGSHNYTVSPVDVGWVPTGGDGKQGYCPFYQWGRKDPFIPLNGTVGSRTYDIDKEVYDINNSPITGITSSSAAVETFTIGVNTKNPTCYYIHQRQFIGSNEPYQRAFTPPYYNMWNAQYLSGTNISTPTVKTIYDPCPPGFCVPTDNLFYFIGDRANNNKRDDRTTDKTNKGKPMSLYALKRYTTGPTLFWPYSGYRAGNVPNGYYTGTYSNVWSTSVSDGRAYCISLYFYQYAWQHSTDSGNIAYAIRPVAEE